MMTMMQMQSGRWMKSGTLCLGLIRQNLKVDKSLNVKTQ